MTHLDRAVVHNPCPADGNTKLQEIKALIAQPEGQYPKRKEYLFSSMQQLPLPNWEPIELKRRPPTESTSFLRLF